ncbi:HTH-type transcriptional regulator GbpR [wastewater metagenome]|uniref:HTH-type transcriptional regulator GbpR n=3 Tax=root TaxID=1 RepID=A0A5B8R6G9_9ZZZZ|nr:LysR substrate-binding domain-containing protein [Arhodomonas aquaeolei]MCS4503626.1 LysR substrate-binding domain-containing protein [Arhodomonas aquaeolei]QEA04589.1 HTH-type transcriptional regulator GbpR [uncultured organism]
MRDLPADWFLRVRLKLRHMQLFVALDEYRNINRAAASLNMSQPAASKLLSDLEHLLGVSVFERQSRGVRPNWYGEILIRHSRTMLAELGQAGEELTALHHGRGGTVSLGTVMPAAVNLLSEAMEAVQRERPNLKVSIEVNVSPRLVEGLHDGTFDFVLARAPEDESSAELVYEEISEEPLCFVCRRHHPLAGQAAVSLEDMAPYVWVLQPPTGLLRQRVERLLLENAVTPPRDIVDTQSILVSLALVEQMDAVTVISRPVAEWLCDPERFTILPFEPRFTVKPFGIVSLRDRPLSPGAAALKETVHRIVARQHEAAGPGP